MLAILGLLGVALTAAAFVETTETEDENERTDAGSADPNDGHATTFDLLDEPVDTDGTESSMMAGTFDMDEMVGTDGTDEMWGEGGDDSLFGGKGDDWLNGGMDDDILWGGAGHDVLYGDGGDDVIVGGNGMDWLEGANGSDTLSGSSGDDNLRGGAGDDVLMGGTGGDVIYGGTGDDVLIAEGTDNLNGGAGADTFDLTLAHDAEIADFDPASDVIEIAYEGDPPVLTTQTEDDSVTLLADGHVVATLPGLTELDVSRVNLIAA